MSPRSERAELLVDTSVAVPLLVADHDLHNSTFEAVGARRLGLAGHAAFLVTRDRRANETYRALGTDVQVLVDP